MAFISSGYNPDKPMENRITDIGPKKYDEFYPPVIAKNKGKWLYHEISETRRSGSRGRIRRRSLHGRCGGARLMSTTHIREICEIADKHCDGHLRFTTRNNIEFMVDSKDKVEPLVKDLESRKFDGGSFKFPVGGTGAGYHQHRSHPGLDSLPHPGHRRFRSGQGHHGRSVRRLPEPRLPAHLRVSLACCLNMCGAVHCSDIAILGYHRKPPMLDHEYLDKMCEIPLAIAACPTAAIKPSKVEVNGEKVNSVAVKNERCMFCGNCYTMCPSMPLADTEGDGIVIMVGGKVSNRISAPKFSKVVVAFHAQRSAALAGNDHDTIKKMSKSMRPTPTNTSVWANGPSGSAGSGSSTNANCRSPIT
jgi:sulfite reductase beta subunit